MYGTRGQVAVNNHQKEGESLVEVISGGFVGIFRVLCRKGRKREGSAGISGRLGVSSMASPNVFKSDTHEGEYSYTLVRHAKVCSGIWPAIDSRRQ
ncbi:predicted protein [Sclerotinia sclerotiorum 1980 UF-70]|uniref:Uncharacterized protein n=1 Tax=Sclerotinia sclerotiorum (strain ATCC 18683 / 1980 / Ss-1) TaxID=665079 RepID=A7EM58_SCLS1|nr:predicted protein [Sclerotinia sclerotiorum 1980 UF-70]EDO03924.1 predicted protein [Sclerotinia sclerotiorum 1980 UF-70]